MQAGMRVWAAVAAVLALAGGFGCHSDGSYQMTWSFSAAADGTPVMADALACASSGVFSIRVVGTSTEGDGDEVETPCAPGQLTRGVPPGTWSFTVTALDGRGRYHGDQFPEPSADADAEADAGIIDYLQAMAGPATVVRDQTVTIPVVMLTPGPTCSDGVDNNDDGRIDLDDPTCRGNPDGTEGAALPLPPSDAGADESP
ncbi:MAG TPA: hypothetical protein VH374_23815 [Polyangia bacterium]|jgi:hypothetical protein|nr:hypothetical protein [Polyangia bacterium]